MDELKAFQDLLRAQRPASWEQLPDFGPYMDQVLSYMDRQVIRFDENDNLTAAMVNNYTKSGLVPRATGKKYNRDHLAYLTAICVLKHVLSAKDTDMLIREELSGRRTVTDAYAEFCLSLDQAMTITADEMEGRMDEETLADAAIHFALLSYAAGAASNKYVSLLRQNIDTTEDKKPAKKPKKVKE